MKTRRDLMKNIHVARVALLVSQRPVCPVHELWLKLHLHHKHIIHANMQTSVCLLAHRHSSSPFLSPLLALIEANLPWTFSEGSVWSYLSLAKTLKFDIRNPEVVDGIDCCVCYRLCCQLLTSQTANCVMVAAGLWS